MDINEIITFNRKTLSSVDNWINKSDWDTPNSLFNYGLPSYILHLINLPVSNDITESDKLCEYLYELYKLNGKINYLEIGVSVGKTFYQIIEFSRQYINENDITLSCLDIEKINPILENLLDSNYKQNKVQLTASKKENSLRKDEFNYITTWNNIKYYESDEFDVNIWKSMEMPYNFIFSDALHDPNALLFEYNSLKLNNLIDTNGFIYCFDDLETEQSGEMWGAVHKILNDIKETYPLLNVTLEHLVVNGWIGEHEYKHNFGVIKAYK